MRAPGSGIRPVRRRPIHQNSIVSGGHIVSRIASYTSLLLLSTALVPGRLLAQEVPEAPPSQTAPAQPAPAAQPEAETPPQQEEIEVSAPGADDAGEIIVTGRFTPNIIQATPEIVSILSAGDIARTGEGDIAGALQRVTGLSVVGGRFVYVRGLGERYSLALLNGSPLPSPEPLRRVVPLDLFPTNILASSVVQKTYSVNYPGEFGGGVINLTTKSAPEEEFIEYGISVGGNSETTFQLGYTYYGSRSDFTGFDNGARDVPGPLRAAFGTGNLIVAGANFTRAQIQDITASLGNANTNLIQQNNNIPVDWGFDVTGGKSFDIGGDFTLGLVGAFGYKNGWQTKGGLQQLSAGISTVNGEQILLPNSGDFRFLSTENRIVVNTLLGLTGEFAGHKVRWTNVFIRDTLKEARIQQGTDDNNIGTDLVNRGYTSWFERQLLDTQLVGEFDFGDFDVDVRATYAQSQRESPYERVNSYRFSDQFNDFFNDLRTNGTFSTIAFSNLKDEVWAGGVDLAYKLPTAFKASVSAGYAYFDNTRSSIRRDFRFLPVDALNPSVAQQRPDFLLSDFNIYNYNILLTETSGNAGAAAYDAGLRVHAGYVQAEIDLTDDVSLQAGVRYEDGDEFVNPLDLFGTGGATLVRTSIRNDYFLPAATLTYNFAEDMQLRFAGSRTIARPQFRELAPQQYLDSEVDRTFFGNQFLIDSTLVNYDIRYEWYFARDQRVSLAGFFKKINRPIETVAFQQGGTFFTTFANAPRAQLYGGELEVQKYFPLESWGGFFTSRRIVAIANYTYSKSEIQVSPGDTTIPVTSAGAPVPATDLFIDGTPLTGQSEHLLNLQLGLEDTDALSQQTFLLTYSSPRVTNRGPSGQPDLIEKPGIRLDFVARQGLEVGGAEIEVKVEVRNITNTKYRESQRLRSSRIINNGYDIGRSFQIGVSAKF
jgi:outer membrane receptor protein involved in Fe transport